jgi:hypothetical protein
VTMRFGIPLTLCVVGIALVLSTEGCVRVGGPYVKVGRTQDGRKRGVARCNGPGQTYQDCKDMAAKTCDGPYSIRTPAPDCCGDSIMNPWRHRIGFVCTSPAQ